MTHCIPRLDIMIAYSCNIACRGCISLSDRRRSGVAPLADIRIWLDQWHHHVTPQVVTLFGGEPCLHPDLWEICAHTRRVWPDATLRLITNGYLLDRFDAGAWFDLGNMEIQVSVHRKDHEHRINDNIRQILEQRLGWQVKQHSGEREHRQLAWTHHSGVTIYKSIFREFIVPYRQQQDQILSWHSDPVRAHSICGAPATPILFRGRLYKCPAVANVMDILGAGSWCDYEPVSPGSDLENFVAHIGRPESCCGQCPDQEQAHIVDHMDKKNVTIKNLD